MPKDRDAKGRFVAGHSIAKSGWDGLVTKRFGGNRAAAWNGWAALVAGPMPSKPGFTARMLSSIRARPNNFWKSSIIALNSRCRM